MLVVTGDLPQFGLENLRAHDNVITTLEVFLAFKILNNSAQHGALGMPDHQPAAGFFVEGEEIQLATELAVITLTCFFQTVQVCFQVFLALEGRCVNPLQHGIFLITTPVSACQTG